MPDCVSRGGISFKGLLKKFVAPKPISYAVMIALITTTTINVLGLFYIVARWLFPQKNGAAANEPKV